MLTRLKELDVPSDRFFTPLDDDASFGDIRIVCAHLIGYMERSLPSNWFEEKQQDESDHTMLKAYGEKLRQLLPDLLKSTKQVDTVHLLLALAKAKISEAPESIKSIGLTYEKLREEIRKI